MSHQLQEYFRRGRWADRDEATPSSEMRAVGEEFRKRCAPHV